MRQRTKKTLRIVTAPAFGPVGMIKAIYQKHKKLEGTGRKLGKADTEYMKQAQALLHGELAVVLGIPFEEVPEYIAGRIE